MKKRLLVILGLVISFGLCIPMGIHAQDFSPTLLTSRMNIEKIEKFEVELTLEQNSDISIKEKIYYYFPTPRHGIYRTIPINKRSEGNALKTPTTINVHSVLYYPADNQADVSSTYSKESNLNSEVLLQIGKGEVTIQGLYIYEIDYTVKNGINYFEDHDELYWNIVGTGWAVPIESVEATINMPGVIQDSICYTGLYASKESDCELTKQSETSIFLTTNSPLEENEAVTIAVSVPKGSIVDVLKKEKERLKYINLLSFSSLLLIPIMYLIVSKQRSSKKTVVPNYTPPKNINPLLAGYLLSKGMLQNKYITAEIINLAVQGLVQIEQKEKKEYVLHKVNTEKIVPLSSSQKLYDTVFANLNDVSTKTINSEMLGQAGPIWAQTKMDAETYNYIDKKKVTSKILFVALGSLLLVGGIWGSLAISLLGSPLGGLAIFVTGVTTFILSFKSDTRSKEGNDVYYELQGLKMYINTAEKHRIEFHNDPKKYIGVFESLLPYAIVFGLEKKWIKEFEDIYTTPPNWYSGDISTFHSLAYMKSLSSFSNKISTPTSQTGGGFSSGGSGFGGGGYSGGGGGGGGGGSW